MLSAPFVLRDVYPAESESCVPMSSSESISIFEEVQSKDVDNAERKSTLEEAGLMEVDIAVFWARAFDDTAAKFVPAQKSSCKINQSVVIVANFDQIIKIMYVLR